MFVQFGPTHLFSAAYKESRKNYSLTENVEAVTRRTYQNR